MYDTDDETEEQTSPQKAGDRGWVTMPGVLCECNVTEEAESNHCSRRGARDVDAARPSAVGRGVPERAGSAADAGDVRCSMPSRCRSSQRLLVHVVTCTGSC